MKQYLAFDSCSNEYEEFDTVQEAQKWIKEGMTCENEISLEGEDSKIYKLHSIVDIVTTDYKSNYLYENEEDDIEETGSVWPYDNDWDSVVDVQFKEVNSESESEPNKPTQEVER